MSKYLFILGKDPDLSLAELYAVYGEAALLDQGREFALLEWDKPLDQNDLDRLGGVIKMAELVAEEEGGNLEKIIFEHIFYSKEKGKIEYGISLYQWSKAPLKKILLDMKAKIKAGGKGSRFANQDFKNLSVAQYKGLRKKGDEYLVVKAKKCFYLARVIGVQDIDAYSLRDYYKPFRSMLVGMLPPKLAQILLNLTQVQLGQKVWDPFCGGGVLLMEGLLMGQEVWGSDIDPQALKGAQQNLAWLQGKFGIEAKVSLFRHDATKPLQGPSADVIACEGYLGPPLNEAFKTQRQQGLLNELTTLYIRFFDALKTIDFRGPIVIALPFFRAKDGEVYLERAVEMIFKLGFIAEPLLPRSSKKSLNYMRDNQWVGRQVMRFRLP